ncbi:homocysteine S-methyltransferase family protein, partial [Enterobacter sichuanensis]
EACETLAGYLPQWLDVGAKLIGGSCRTTPKDIAELNAKR